MAPKGAFLRNNLPFINQFHRCLYKIDGPCVSGRVGPSADTFRRWGASFPSVLFFGLPLPCCVRTCATFYLRSKDIEVWFWKARKGSSKRLKGTFFSPGFSCFLCLITPSPSVHNPRILAIFERSVYMGSELPTSLPSPCSS